VAPCGEASTLLLRRCRPPLVAPASGSNWAAMALPAHRLRPPLCGRHQEDAPSFTRPPGALSRLAAIETGPGKLG